MTVNYVSLGDNSFSNIFFWRDGNGIPPLKPGSVLITCDEGPIHHSLNHVGIAFGQLIRSGIYSSSMHAAIVLDSREEEGKTSVLLAEAQVDGIHREWVKFEEMGKLRDADTVWVFTPKGSSLRNTIVDLASQSTAPDRKKQPYNFIGAFKTVFKKSTDLNPAAIEKISGVVVDAIQGREWGRAEYCSSYVTLLLQAATVLQGISEEQRRLIQVASRELAVHLTAEFQVKDRLIDRLRCNSDRTYPNDLFNRLLAN